MNKCIGDDTKAAARQRPNCIKKQKKYGEKRFSIWGWNSYTLQCACGSENMTVNSPSGSTLQCDTWLWDDMPLNSPKRPPYWNSTSSFDFDQSPQSTFHSAPVCEILSKSDHPNIVDRTGPPSAEKNDVMTIFKMANLSHLGF